MRPGPHLRVAVVLAVLLLADAPAPADPVRVGDVFVRDVRAFAPGLRADLLLSSKRWPLRIAYDSRMESRIRVLLVEDDGRLAAFMCEFEILRVLAERQNRVVTREQLLDLAQGSAEESFDRSIDVRISRLRQKLGEHPRRPSLLRTVRRAGYMLADDGET